ncbi:hypothetical protein [Candidatus Desulfovibrio trichonymphae]|uniref:hypothetical protein n=1 Tax=Candidatus Desulfovibrio trichonymphae TaxID=1725232 RepID=UPI000BBAAD17|nr:hypothetical protein [Candidatus Desulfovibrio trichonymphae]GHU92212.1 hypothetical protein AGMMS49925_09890 [Deltaproteobacteria bacterium]GHU96418.1 hypothetical protein AGMMS49974_10490 [Deltaproteobacteria bacterium]GHV00359.1 hypothetical protein AGMMS50248_09940 [Deltaproteobacteria bacterium]
MSYAHAACGAYGIENNSQGKTHALLPASRKSAHRSQDGKHEIHDIRPLLFAQREKTPQREEDSSLAAS